jgi:hypothetical protein
VTDPSAQRVPGHESRCPWCSSVVPPDAPTCPTCGAALREPPDADAAIPGVTKVDPGVSVRRPLKRPNRLVGWLAGEGDPLPPDPLPPGSGSGGAAGLAAAGPFSVEPPSPDVRREMLRLEVEAIRAELEARTGAPVQPPVGSPAAAPADAAPPEAASPDATEPGPPAEGTPGG